MARFLNIPHPALFDSSSESVIVCSSKIRTICSRNKSFLHFVSSIILAMAIAADDLFFVSGLVKSVIIGSIWFSRITASSGSEGGLTVFPIGFARSLVRSLRLALPMMNTKIERVDLGFEFCCVLLEEITKRFWKYFDSLARLCKWWWGNWFRAAGGCPIKWCAYLFSQTLYPSREAFPTYIF
jgi:hypothetical protein